ncbi:helix-turn-helix domain-containing protein [Pseudomonas sp. PDM22]|uniref:helix-turn-helix domain-containing protein n=1 Tax=Pseudomonas sp. PDM22 TaxID=2769287 RepID=UPI0009DA7900|nr:helix-turn-helix domain-containing protein [Pseudomonas sp. PDM22]MBD9515977.1 helix-turn-helix domain-containing protein [Pseudomonas sp. PDM22]OQR29900.1 AraC family transcriptional regulator [Pseudomonas sp. T]
MTGIARHQATDSDELACALAGWSQDYTQLGHGRLQAELLHVQLPGASLIYEHSNLHLHENMAPPAGHLVIGIPLRASADSRFNGQALHDDTLLVLEGGRELEICAAGEIHMLGLTFSQPQLERLLGAEERELFERALQQRRLELSPTGAGDLRRSLCDALAAFESEPWRVDDPQQAGHAVALVLSHVLQALEEILPGNDREGAPRSLQQHRRLVLAAIERMQADLSEPLSLLELSQSLNTSQRTLQYCFRQICQSTPQQFFLSLRLAEARRRLKQEPQQSITHLALDLGFASSSHFSALYKRLYAEQPSVISRAR